MSFQDDFQGLMQDLQQGILLANSSSGGPLQQAGLDMAFDAIEEIFDIMINGNGVKQSDPDLYNEVVSAFGQQLEATLVNFEGIIGEYPANTQTQLTNYVESLGEEIDLLHSTPTSGNNTLVGEEGAGDIIYGLEGDDDISGLSGNDILRGGSGDDIIRGGEGDDVLDDGLGNDIIYGGSGTNYMTLTVNAGDMDIIGDLSADDNLQIINPQGATIEGHSISTSSIVGIETVTLTLDLAGGGQYSVQFNGLSQAELEGFIDSGLIEAEDYDFTATTGPTTPTNMMITLVEALQDAQTVFDNGGDEADFIQVFEDLAQDITDAHNANDVYPGYLEDLTELLQYLHDNTSFDNFEQGNNETIQQLVNSLGITISSTGPQTTDISDFINAFNDSFEDWEADPSEETEEDVQEALDALTPILQGYDYDSSSLSQASLDALIDALLAADNANFLVDALEAQINNALFILGATASPGVNTTDPGYGNAFLQAQVDALVDAVINSESYRLDNNSEDLTEFLNDNPSAIDLISQAQLDAIDAAIEAFIESGHYSLNANNEVNDQDIQALVELLDLEITDPSTGPQTTDISDFINAFNDSFEDWEADPSEETEEDVQEALDALTPILQGYDYDSSSLSQASLDALIDALLAADNANFLVDALEAQINNALFILGATASPGVNTTDPGYGNAFLQAQVDALVDAVINSESYRLDNNSEDLTEFLNDNPSAIDLISQAQLDAIDATIEAFIESGDYSLNANNEVNDADIQALVELLDLEITDPSTTTPPPAIDVSDLNAAIDAFNAATNEAEGDAAEALIAVALDGLEDVLDYIEANGTSAYGTAIVSLSTALTELDAINLNSNNLEALVNDAYNTVHPNGDATDVDTSDPWATSTTPPPAIDTNDLIAAIDAFNAATNEAEGDAAEVMIADALEGLEDVLDYIEANGVTAYGTAIVSLSTALTELDTINLNNDLLEALVNDAYNTVHSSTDATAVDTSDPWATTTNPLDAAVEALVVQIENAPHYLADNFSRDLYDLLQANPTYVVSDEQKDRIDAALELLLANDELSLDANGMFEDDDYNDLVEYLGLDIVDPNGTNGPDLDAQIEALVAQIESAPVWVADNFSKDLFNLLQDNPNAVVSDEQKDRIDAALELLLANDELSLDANGMFEDDDFNDLVALLDLDIVDPNATTGGPTSTDLEGLVDELAAALNDFDNATNEAEGNVIEALLDNLLADIAPFVSQFEADPSSMGSVGEYIALIELSNLLNAADNTNFADDDVELNINTLLNQLGQDIVSAVDASNPWGGTNTGNGNGGELADFLVLRSDLKDLYYENQNDVNDNIPEFEAQLDSILDAILDMSDGVAGSEANINTPQTDWVLFGHTGIQNLLDFINTDWNLSDDAVAKIVEVADELGLNLSSAINFDPEEISFDFEAMELAEVAIDADADAGNTMMVTMMNAENSAGLEAVSHEDATMVGFCDSEVDYDTIDLSYDEVDM